MSAPLTRTEATEPTEALARRNPPAVIEEVTGWLRVFDDGTVDRTWTGPPEALPLMQPVPPYAEPRDGVSVHDISVHDISGEPVLRLYIPGAGHRIQLPVLLHFHGGGFCISHPSWLMYHHFYSRIARELPAAVVSVELPLAPEHRLPAAIDAGLSALLRLRCIAEEQADEAERLLARSVDFSRVFLIGDSSGGNLVHLVAARAMAEDFASVIAPVRIAGAIPLNPGFARSTRSRSELEQKPDLFFTLEMLDKFLKLALPLGATKDHAFTCPMGPLSPPLERIVLPPMLVAVAEIDLIVDTNLEYCDALKNAGKEVEVVFLRNVGHCFYLNKFAVDMDPVAGERALELIAAIGDFVARH